MTIMFSVQSLGDALSLLGIKLDLLNADSILKATNSVLGPVLTDN